MKEFFETLFRPADDYNVVVIEMPEHKQEKVKLFLTKRQAFALARKLQKVNPNAVYGVAHWGGSREWWKL